jgi:quinolinate synthase
MKTQEEEEKDRLLVQRIRELKAEKNAVILVHNYQRQELYDIADYLGDSLGLSQEAARTDAEVILFCGVHFMAETACILSPEKLVLMPDLHAGCPMADMITAGQLRELKSEHPGAVVVCYVNTSAEVKAESDFCCTSANAARVIASIGRSKEIIFVPDRHLGEYASSQSNRKVILWEGFCPTHAAILPAHILEAKKRYPDAAVMVHPECTKEVTRLADAVLSTGGMVRYPKTSPATRFIVGTETGMLNRLKREYPDREFYPATELAICRDMKVNSLEKVLRSLEEMQYEVRVPEEIRLKAKRSIDRMLRTGRDE